MKVTKAIFPVAGLGTRFLPATKAVPKEMLTVVDRPVIQHVVDEAREGAYDLVVIGVGEAVITPGFNLPNRWVIHAVGPRYFDDPDPPALSVVVPCRNEAANLAALLPRLLDELIPLDVVNQPAGLAVYLVEILE